MTTIERVRWRVGLDVYLRMIEVGVLGKYDRVELIEGAILEKPRRGRRHAAVSARLMATFAIGLEHRALTSPVGLVRLPPSSAPEPTLKILTHRDDDYTTAYPGPNDVALVIEVADSSLLFDRNSKLPLYARSGIREAWLVDLVHGLVVVATEPGPDGYGSIVEHRAGATIAPVAFPDVTVDVTDLLR